MDIFSVSSNAVVRNCQRAAELAPPEGGFGQPYTDRHLVVLCMTPRSGSSHLGALMKANGLGWGAEHFNINTDALQPLLEQAGVKTYDQYIRHVVDTRTHEGVFCVKADWQQYTPVYYFGAHQHYFAGASFLYLTRGDILMQAISRYVASETRYFHSTNVKTAHTLKDDVPFDFDRISKHLQTLVGMQSAWEWFFASEGIRPLRITYEELEKDPKEIVRRISAHTGIALKGPPKDDSEFTVVRNERNDMLREKFVAHAKSLRDSEGARLIRQLLKKVSV